MSGTIDNQDPRGAGLSDQADESSRLLDEAVAGLKGSRRTFSDREALARVWDAGYDISPQMDPRFVLTCEADNKHPRQWRLVTQAVANDRLLDLLVSGQWNGYGLDAELARLDAEDQTHYVFCPVDSRFHQRPDGAFEPADREPRVSIPPSIKAALDALEPALLQQWQDEGGEPWTANHILETFCQLGWPDATRPDAWRLVGAWLRASTKIARVGPDYWIPAERIPSASSRERLQVLPMPTAAPSGEPSAASVTPTTPSEKPDVPPGPAKRAPLSDRPDVLSTGSIGAQQASWTIPLRTINLIEGFVQVPRSVRHVYPRRREGELDRAVLNGLWFENGQKLWVWLDRNQDRLYGPDLADQLAWLEAGDRLRTEWKPDVIIFRLTGHDEEVQREETRLVDLDALRTMRAERGESYLHSLQDILGSAPDGLTFPELVRAICDRQGHEVHRGTIRSLLHLGGFVFRDGRWCVGSDATAGMKRFRSIKQTTVSDATNDIAGSGQEENPVQTSDIRITVRKIRTRLSEIIAELQAEQQK